MYGSPCQLLGGVFIKDRQLRLNIVIHKDLMTALWIVFSDF